MPLIAVAALASGAAVATGVATAATIGMIGLGATVVGTLTKSRELTEIGAGMGLSSGVASIVEGIGSAATDYAANAAGDAARGGLGFDEWAAQQGAAEMATGAEDLMLGSAPSWAGSAASGQAAKTGITQGLLGSSSNAAGSTANLSPVEIERMGNATVDIGSDALNKMPALAKPSGTDPGSIASWWGKQSDQTKNTILQMGGKALGSMFEGWTTEQKLALERERANLEREKYNTSMSNASSQPTVIRSPTIVGGGLLSAKRG